MSGCTGRLRYSWGSDHGVDSPGALRAALDGDHGREVSGNVPEWEFCNLIP